MDMVEVNTSDLIGPALDWAVAHNLNGEPVFFEAFGARMLGRRIATEAAKGNISPSTKWSQCGPLIDAYDVDLRSSVGGDIVADIIGENGVFVGCGPDRMTAICRAIVAAKCGYTLQVPAELMPQSEK